MREPNADKASIRAIVQSAIAALDEDERRRADASIAGSTVALPEWEAADEVLLYRALADEVATDRLLETAFSHGKRLFLPRVDGVELTFHEVHSPSELAAMERHRWGMHEPARDARAWSAPPPHGTRSSGATGAARRVLVVCPGRAFDPAGNRLGRGGGYYDRFLAAHRLPRPDTRGSQRPVNGGEVATLRVIGICYDLQIVEALPASPHDAPVDAIVTESRTLLSD